jgi:hypothetical protein
MTINPERLGSNSATNRHFQQLYNENRIPTYFMGLR